MERLKLNPKEIYAAKNEYKKDDFVLFEKLKKSIKEFGQLRPINCTIINNTAVCFEGKKILKAFEELGFEEIEVLVFDKSKNIDVLHLIFNEMNFASCDLDLSEKLNKMENVKQSLIPFTQLDVKAYRDLQTFDWGEFSRKEASTQINMFSLESEVEKVEKKENQKEQPLKKDEVEKVEKQPIEYSKEGPPTLDELMNKN